QLFCSGNFISAAYRRGQSDSFQVCRNLYLPRSLNDCLYLFLAVYQGWCGSPLGTPVSDSLFIIVYLCPRNLPSNRSNKITKHLTLCNKPHWKKERKK